MLATPAPNSQGCRFKSCPGDLLLTTILFSLMIRKPLRLLSITTTVPVAQWIRRVTTNHEIGGSNPSGDGEDGLVGYDDCLTRSRSRVRSSVLVSLIQEAMAQRQRVGFQTRRLGVQIPLASMFFGTPRMWECQLYWFCWSEHSHIFPKDVEVNLFQLLR